MRSIWMKLNDAISMWDYLVVPTEQRTREGLSPTEREFDRATTLGVHRLIFVKGAETHVRHPKMEALIGKAQAGLIRKRFNTQVELVTGLYAALVEYLEVKELIRWGPFDAAPCAKAVLEDLDFERIIRFIRTARRARQFPLPEDSSPEELLEHLKLLNDGRLTNAAVLLFGKAPQRHLISSEVRCAHFHGTEVAKPIPSYQVYKGTVFELVDQAVDFVLSKINRSIGTRTESARAPRTYEIPEEVVTEAIVKRSGTAATIRTMGACRSCFLRTGWRSGILAGYRRH